MRSLLRVFYLFSFEDPAPTELYTLSLHDALPISLRRTSAASTGLLRGAGSRLRLRGNGVQHDPAVRGEDLGRSEEHSLNSSHVRISYAVFCLKKKKTPLRP